MTLNKKLFLKNNIMNRYLSFIYLIIIFWGQSNLVAQESYKLNELEINRSTNSDENGNVSLPSNPFELVEMLRRANSMNDATNPSDAIDEAIKSFDMIKDK